MGANGLGLPSKPNGSRISSSRRSQDQPPDGIEPGNFVPAVFGSRPKGKTLTPGEGARALFTGWGLGGWGRDAHPVVLTTPQCSPRSGLRRDLWVRCPRRLAIYACMLGTSAGSHHGPSLSLGRSGLSLIVAGESHDEARVLPQFCGLAVGRARCFSNCFPIFWALDNFRRREDVPLGSGRIDSIMRHGVNPLSNANAAISKCGIPVAFRLFNIAHCPKKRPRRSGVS